MDHRPNLTVEDLIRDRQIANEMSVERQPAFRVTGLYTVRELKNRFNTNLILEPYNR